jgi:erythromycin esterase-like protein
MTAALQRLVRRSDEPPEQTFNSRDRSMAQLVEWHRARLPAGTKIVVWCHNVHAARDLRSIAAAAALVPLGAILAQRSGPAVAAIGFSARAGSFARGARAPTVIEPAAPQSLEALASGEVAYLDRARLLALGARPGRLAEYRVVEGNWAEIFDGMIVVDRERPPQLLAPPAR